MRRIVREWDCRIARMDWTARGWINSGYKLIKAHGIESLYPQANYNIYHL